MKKSSLLSSILVIVFGGVVLYGSSNTTPASLLPNPTLTPGVTATSDIKVLKTGLNSPSYSQTHRSTTDAMKRAVYAEYGITEHKTGEYEIDHFVPLCAGGADDTKNLWPEPSINTWSGVNYGFHEKDRLETYICLCIQAGQLDPKMAQDKLMKDWVVYYKEVFGKGFDSGALGQGYTDLDGDGE